MVDSVSVLVVRGSRDDDRLYSVLERDHAFSVTVAEDGAVDECHDVAPDCVLSSERLLDEADRDDDVSELLPKGARSAPLVVVHETSEQAVHALAVGVDRGVRRHDDTESLAREVAAVVRQAVAERADATESPHETVDLVDRAVDTLTDIFFVFDLNGRFLHWNERVSAVTGYSDEAIGEMHPVDFVAAEDVADVTAAIARAIDEGQAQIEAEFVTADSERVPYEFTGSLLRTDDGDPIAICGTGRDISNRQARERALERQADRLETLNHINAVIRDVNEALVRARSREGIEQAVCDHLVADTPYRFAWIGTLNVTSEDVEPRAWAGVEDGYLDARVTDDPTEETVTAATAIREGCVLVAQNVADDVDDVAWRNAALSRGYQSAAAIPLSYRDTSYGVLCLYAPRPNAFDETERTVLAELGETVGYAISAAEQRRALVTDSVVEVDLTLSDGPFFVTAAAELNCEVSLEGASETDGELREFLTVRGAHPEDVASLARQQGGSATVVNEFEDAGVLRVRTPDPSLTALVADCGGVLRSAAATDGEGTVTVELPQNGDIRALVGALRDVYPSVAVRAQRERERTSTGGLEFRGAFEDALTNRQREVLETAYLAGYFDWPRGSTAEEVAESLDVSAPTFHEHIRRIQRKLLVAFFETDRSTPW